MLRNALLVIGHVLTVDVIGVVEKKSWVEYKNTGS